MADDIKTQRELTTAICARRDYESAMNPSILEAGRAMLNIIEVELRNIDIDDRKTADMPSFVCPICGDDIYAYYEEAVSGDPCTACWWVECNNICCSWNYGTFTDFTMDFHAISKSFRVQNKGTKIMDEVLAECKEMSTEEYERIQQEAIEKAMCNKWVIDKTDKDSLYQLMIDYGYMVQYIHFDYDGAGGVDVILRYRDVYGNIYTIQSKEGFVLVFSSNSSTIEVIHKDDLHKVELIEVI